jgi:hypothetical protein
MRLVLESETSLPPRTSFWLPSRHSMSRTCRPRLAKHGRFAPQVLKENGNDC